MGGSMGVWEEGVWECGRRECGSVGGRKGGRMRKGWKSVEGSGKEGRENEEGMEEGREGVKQVPQSVRYLRI